jgi:hypothetical protein
MGKAFSLQWIGRNSKQLLFSGVIDHLTVLHQTDHSVIELSGYSPLNDSLNRQRKFFAFQKKNQTLLDILNEIKGFRYKIVGDAFKDILSQPYSLGIQSGETDFAYIRNLLSSLGVPVLIDEDKNEFIIGFQNKANDESVSYRPEKDPYFTLRNICHATMSENIFLPSGKSYPDWEQRKNSDGFQKIVPRIETMQRMAGSVSISFTTRNQLFYPGDLIRHRKFPHREKNDTSENDKFLRVTRVRYEYRHTQDDLSVSVDCLENPDSIFVPTIHAPPPSGKLLGTVLKTNNDPLKMGRVQVGLFVDQNNFDKSRVACWLPVITPYQGAFDGFSFLPEAGNRVIVECLDLLQGQWAVTGTLRTRKHPIETAKPEQVKTLRTSRGNQIVFESRPSASLPVREIIRIENGINTIEFDSKIKSGQITVSQNGKMVFKIALKTLRKQTVEIVSAGDIILKARGISS